MRRLFIPLFCVFTVCFGFLLPQTVIAQPLPGGLSGALLDTWSFSSTNLASQRGYLPAASTNIYLIPNAEDGNTMWLDATNLVPAYLLYHIVETNGSTNINLTNGSISFWFNPDWASTNLFEGTGPGDWANLLSVGQAGTNGTSWWALYLNAAGTQIYFSSQATNTSSSNYFTAPVSFNFNTWYNIVLTYGPTNSAIYTNGALITNGTGVVHVPGTESPVFAVGSDTNGFYQSQGMFDDINTYNYQLDPGEVAGAFSVYSFIYYGMPMSFSTNAPSTNSVVPVFDAVTGAGFLTTNGLSSTYSTSTNIWITNYSATAVSSNVMNVGFAVAGGSNNVPYDVFATGALLYPITNSTWFWMGQAYRGTNYFIPITNIPPTGICLILGTPHDSDSDGLTDAYELLVSHTSPTNPVTSGDGMLDGWKILWGLNPLINSTTQSNLLSNFNYDPTGRLKAVTGIRTESVSFDAEGNIQGDSQ